MPEIYRWFAEQPGEVKKEIVKAAMKGVVDSRLQAVADSKTKMRDETVRMKTRWAHSGNPPGTFTEAELVLHRDLKARNYFEDLKAKVKSSRRSLQEQREQKLPTKEARREAFRVEGSR